MSLILAINVPSCIVCATDKRTTFIDAQMRIDYTDETKKIFKINEQMILMTCGSNLVNHTLTISECIDNFVYDNKDNLNDERIIPNLLLKYLNSKNCISNIQFILCGYNNLKKSFECTFSTLGDINFECKDDNIFTLYSLGMKEVCSAISTDINFTYLSKDEAIRLAKLCMKATIDAYDFKSQKSVGGLPDIYVIDRKLMKIEKI